MDNQEQPAPTSEASAPKVAERPLWELSRDEQCVLIITFVGGLASIVAGVCVVGGAIALVRGLRALDFPPSVLAILTMGTSSQWSRSFVTAATVQGTGQGSVCSGGCLVCRVLYSAAGLDRYGCGHPLMRCRRVPSDAPAWSWFTGWSDVLGQVVAGVDPVHGVGDAADRVADADRVAAVGAGTRVPGDPRFDCHTAGIPRARRGRSAGGIATDAGRGLPWLWHQDRRRAGSGPWPEGRHAPIVPGASQSRVPGCLKHAFLCRAWDIQSSLHGPPACGNAVRRVS